MSLSPVRIVNRGPTGLKSEVWIGDYKVPSVQRIEVHESAEDVHRVVITIFANPVTIEYETTYVAVEGDDK